MCTVVFIPTLKGCIMASLRDERPERPRALHPQKYSKNNLTYVSPKDMGAGGTWISVNEKNTAIVLLNGAYTGHIKSKAYSKSRGLIVAELSGIQMPVVYWNRMDLENIEPFTLVIWENENLYELVWDGKSKIQKKKNHDTPHLWSSSTLYNEASKKVRKDLFETWFAENPLINDKSLLTFFETYNDNQNGFLINRNELVKTISYTFIEIERSNIAVMNYFDFQTKSASVQSIVLRSSDKYTLCIE